MCICYEPVFWLKEALSLKASCAPYFTAVRKPSQPVFSDCGNTRPYLEGLLQVVRHRQNFNGVCGT